MVASLVLSGKESTCQCRGHGLVSGSKDPLEKRLLTPGFLPGKSHSRGAWWATVHEVEKNQAYDLATKQQQHSQS